MNKFYHPFHLVTYSPWPILISFSILNNLLITINWFQYSPYIFTPKSMMYLCSLMSTFFCMIMWWRDVIREATFQGCHTNYVYNGLRLGMILFITSEVLFFFSFFWAYFHSSLSPSIEIGQLWPPKSILPFNPYDIPLLNTIILISSGLTITWSHHSMLSMKFKESKTSLIITITLGLLFTLIQLFEYNESTFTFSDSIYGSTFFIATGFHGLHVIIGSIFLMICLTRMKNLQFSMTHHFGFEAASWYWHFVDVIWLFLYISIYWWSF